MDKKLREPKSFGEFVLYDVYGGRYSSGYPKNINVGAELAINSLPVRMAECLGYYYARLAAGLSRSDAMAETCECCGTDSGSMRVWRRKMEAMFKQPSHYNFKLLNGFEVRKGDINDNTSIRYLDLPTAMINKLLRWHYTTIGKLRKCEDLPMMFGGASGDRFNHECWRLGLYD